MYPYLAMLTVPSALALMAPRARRPWLLLVGCLFALIIGFRFRVGMDWDNYIDIYQSTKGVVLFDLIFQREPGYQILMWASRQLGAGMVLINFISATIFCLGFFAVARRSREPWLAIAVATPLLAVAFAMSGVRQALAAGIVFYVMAHWSEYRTPKRILMVVLASLFHFSAIFILIFVALGSNASRVVRYGGTIFIGAGIIAIVNWAPASVEGYSRLYLGSGGKFSAPGAIFQLAPIAAAGLLYFLNRRTWIEVNGYDPLFNNMAWASLLAVPAIYFSSVGAYRFGLYLWPMAMTVYAGIPATIGLPTGRAFYRLMLVVATFGLLIGWLLLGNNSYAWMPYQNWLLQPDGVTLLKRHHMIAI